MIKITTATQAELLSEIEVCLTSRIGFTVATLNLDHIVKLGRDKDFREAYAKHSHIVADGRPVVWLRRLAGQRVDLVTGSDLVVPLAVLAAKLNTTVVFFGSTKAALDAARDRLVDQVPDFKVVATIAPVLGFDPNGAEADAFLAMIDASGAELCLVALGAPKQEIFASRGRDRLPGCGFVSVGAGLDFIAGTQKRAPAWVRALAFEWAWRLIHDWRRLFRRYLDCALVLPSLIIAAFFERFGVGRGTT